MSTQRTMIPKIGERFRIIVGKGAGRVFKVESEPIQDAFGEWFVWAKRGNGSPEVWHLKELKRSIIVQSESPEYEI